MSSFFIMGDGAAATCSASARIGVQLRLIVDKYMLDTITLMALGQFCKHTNIVWACACSDIIFQNTIPLIQLGRFKMESV